MVGPTTSAHLRRGGSRAAIPALFTISEEDEQHRSAVPRRPAGTHSQPKSDEKKTSGRPMSSGGGAGSKAEPVALKIDERLRQARERREEQEKLVALRESAWLEREQRARLFYEKQLEERRRKLEEQRCREEKRRAAVEEKRRQRLEEEKARHEAVMRRTLERSQKVKQKTNRWSWGGGLHGNSVQTSDADRRSVSTVNLSKHAEPVITKRLSSSSATLLNSPDRALQKRTSLLNKPQSNPRLNRDRTSRDKPTAVKRLPLTPWESTIVNRLLTPTHSFLARSRSAMSLSGDAASCHPMSATSFKSLQCRGAERSRAPSTSLDAANRRRTVGVADKREKDKDYVRKSWSNLSVATPAVSMRSRSPGTQKSRKSVPSPARVPSKPGPRPPTPRQVRSPTPSGLEPLRPSVPLSPGNLRPHRTLPDPQPEPSSTDQTSMAEQHNAESLAAVSKQEALVGPTELQPAEEPAELTPEHAEESAPKGQKTDHLQTEPSPATPSQVPPPASATKPSAGTTDPEEASRLLAEKRRQAREQREREEEERRREQEAERHKREEMARWKAEEQARREEKEREERKRREEAEKQAEEEKAQREQEEAERLQKQKEEEEARQREAAEQQRLERERRFQKEEAERMQRKKRLEEIMKRTRRSDPPEKKSVPQRNGDLSQQVADETSAQTQSDGTTELQHNERNGPELDTSAGSAPSMSDSQSKENGVPEQDHTFEEVLNLPVGTTLPRLDMDADGLLPVVAFKENGSLRTLVSVDEVQVQHTADVV